MESLSAEKWSQCLDSEGRVLDQYNVRKIVFHKGISEDIRNEVWLFLVGYYPFDSTDEERKRIDREKREKYELLLESWSKPEHMELSNDFEEDAKIIEKDSKRTDRTLEFFSEQNIHNTLMLERVLKTFALLRPDIGYVQGMSDILALPLVVLNNEHQAFWCFDYTMKMMQGKVFSDLTLCEPLENLAKLCRYIDKPLFDHIDLIYEGEQWLFAYRLILLNFKRELTIQECSRLWECFWSCHATQNFPLLFTATVLVHFRDTLFKCTDFEQLMQFSQCLKGNVPLDVVLSHAIELLEQLKSDEYCPYDIKFLVSNEVSAPPPLVGFVRARQRVTSLYSRKTDMQREQIWRALFGDTPVQSITSPFMLSPTATTDPKHSVAVDSNWSTPCHTREPSSSERRTTAVCNASSPNTHVAPPKMGFVPREGNTSFRLRDDIRRLCLSSNYSEHSFTDESSAEIPSTVETPSAMGTDDSYKPETLSTMGTLSTAESIYTAGMSDTVNSYTAESVYVVKMNDTSYTPATLSTVVMDDTTVASYTPATLSTVVMDDTTVASYTPATLSTVVMDDTTVASYTPATLSTVVMDDTTVASYTPATLSTVVMNYASYTLSTAKMNDTVNHHTSVVQPLHDLVPLSSSSAADESESLEDTKLPQSSQHMNKQLVTCRSNTSYTASTASTNGCEDCPQFDNLRSEAQLTCF